MSGLDHPLSYKKFFPNHADQIHLNQEIEMYDTLMAEVFGIKGVPIDYYASTFDPNSDRIFGEDTKTKYSEKRQLTAILKDGTVEETLLINGFGQLNVIEFSMYLHINTFKKLYGINSDPKPSDQFLFPGNSNLRFEITHVGYSTLGMAGNVFGNRSAYEIICKEAEISPATEGVSEQFSIIQVFIPSEQHIGNEIQIINPKFMKLEDLTIQQCHLGKKFIVLLPDIPCDAILPDGRIADKYQVKLPPDLLKEIKLGDNQYINDAAYNDVHADFNVDLRKPVVIQRNRDFWGGW